MSTDDSVELDPAASETELLKLLHDKYADFLDGIYKAYRGLNDVKCVSSSHLGEGLKEVECELQLVRPQIFKVDPKKTKTGEQQSTVKKSMLSVSSLMKRDSKKLDSALKNTVPVQRPKLTRMGSKSLPGSPPRNPEPSTQNKYKIIDEAQVKLALSAFNDEDTKILADAIKSLMFEYKAKTLIDPVPEIVDYYMNMTKGTMKKKKRSIASLAMSQSKLKNPMTPQLSTLKDLSSTSRQKPSIFNSQTAKTVKKPLNSTNTALKPPN